MPTIITSGAASAKGYGFAGGGKAFMGSGFVTMIGAGGYGADFRQITYDQNGNGYVSGFISPAIFSGRRVVAKLAAETGNVLWSYTFDASNRGEQICSIAFYSGHVYVFVDSPTSTIVKITADGSYVGAKSITGLGNAKGMVMDSSGNFYLFASSGAIAYVAKLNSAYVPVWFNSYTNTIAGGSLDFAYSNLNMGPGENSLTFHAYWDGNYTLPYQPVMCSIEVGSGSVITGWRHTTIEQFRSSGIVDSSGNFYAVIGSGTALEVIKANSFSVIWKVSISNTAGADNIITLDPTGNIYIYSIGYKHLLKLDNNGAVIWAKSINNPGDYASIVYSNAAKLLYIGRGIFQGAAYPMSIPSVNGPVDGTYAGTVISSITRSSVESTSTWTYFLLNRTILSGLTVTDASGSMSWISYSLTTTNAGVPKT